MASKEALKLVEAAEAHLQSKSFAEATEAAAGALEKAQKAKDGVAEGRAFQITAKILAAQNKRAEAIQAYKDAAAAFKPVGGDDAKKGQSDSLLGALTLHLEAGESRKAADVVDTIRAVFVKDKDAEGEAGAVLAVASTKLAAGFSLEAIAGAQDANGLYKKAKDFDGQCSAMFLVVDAHVDRRDLPAAGKAAEEIVELCSSERSKSNESKALMKASEVHMLMGDTGVALKNAKLAAEVAGAAKDTETQAKALLNLAQIQVKLNDSQEALRTTNDAIQVCEKGKHKKLQKQVLDAVVEANLLAERDRDALSTANDALSLAREIGDKYEEAGALHALGQIFLSKGDTRSATEQADEMRSICRDSGNTAGEAAALHTLASAKLAEDMFSEEGFEQAEQSVSLFKTCKDCDLGRATAQHTLANVYFNQGKLEEGLQQAREALITFKLAGDTDQEATLKASVDRFRLEISNRRVLYPGVRPPVKLEVPDVKHAPAGKGCTVCNTEETLTTRQLQNTIADRSIWGVPKMVTDNEESANLADDEPPHCVLYSVTCTDNISSEVCTDFGLFATAMAKRDVKLPILIKTSGAYTRNVCEIAPCPLVYQQSIALWGMTRCIRQEMPQVIVALLDITSCKTTAQVSRCLKPFSVESAYYHGGNFQPIIEQVPSLIRASMQKSGPGGAASSNKPGVDKKPQFMRKPFSWTGPNNKMDFCWYRQSWRMVYHTVNKWEEGEGCDYPENPAQPL